MRIFSWNVNGLRAALKKGFLDWVKQESPDVICLQEIKVRREELGDEVVNLEGYQTIWNPASRRGYSGVAIFTRKKPKVIHKGMGIEKFDDEGRIIRLEFKHFDLLNVYFPNGTSGPERLQFKMDFYGAFLEHIDGLRDQGKKLVICGDVNTAHQPIDLKNPKANEKNSGFLPEERAWIDKLIEHGYVDTFREFCQEPGQYTWWTYRFNARQRNIGWRLDYFFVSDDLMGKIQNSFICPEVMGSDHCPVGLDIKSQ